MMFWFWISILVLIGACLAMSTFLKSRWIAVSIFLAIFLVSLTLYLTSGRYTQWKQHLAVQAHMAKVQSDIQQFGQPTTLIRQLEEKIQTTKQDPKAWYFLGRLYLGTGQLTKAQQAFKQTVALNPKDQESHVLWIQTNFLLQGTLTSSEKAFLLTLLKTQPNSLSALNLLARYADQHKHYALAIEYWTRMLKHLPPEAIEERRSIQEKIHQAQKKSG